MNCIQYMLSGDKVNLTLPEYITQRLEEIRNIALLKAMSKTPEQTTLVYSYDVYGKSNDELKQAQSHYKVASLEYQDALDRAYEEYKEKYPILSEKLTVFSLIPESEDLDIANAAMLHYKKILDTCSNDSYRGEPVANCIANLSEMYPHGLPTGNRTFKKDPQKYGFTLIPLEDIQPGDIVQHLSRYFDGIPTHALMYNGQDNNGRPVWAYSNGSTWVGHHKYYPVLEDEDNFLKEALVYRYTGTSQDSIQWANDWANEYTTKKLGGKLNYLNLMKK